MKKLSGIALLALLASCTIFYPPERNLPPRASVYAGEQVTVKGSQNVYTVSRAYNVSMRDLIVVNNLQPPYILHDGQRIVLPAAAPGGYAPPPMPSGPVGISAIEQAPLPPARETPLREGETEHRGGAGLAPVTAEELSTPSPVKPLATTAQSPPAVKEHVAAMTPPAAPTPPPQPEENVPPVLMVWPVQGPILSSFGPKGQGLNNDGINIGAPKGTPVAAAMSGIVVYAGNEMKGFGNLVLIRHQGGWVTAYAHLGRMLVKKDAVVAQGDMIGTVGSTGGVSSPQLHFETRYQSKPVDPAGVIKKN